MAELTVRIHDEALERAQRLAVERGLSVEELVGVVIMEAREQPPRERQILATEQILRIARESKAGAIKGGQRWNREEIYDEAISYPE